MTEPLVKSLQEDDALSQTRIERFSDVKTDPLVESLEPAVPASVKTRLDGTMMMSSSDESPQRARSRMLIRHPVKSPDATNGIS